MAGKRIETMSNSDVSSLPSETSEKKKKKKGLIRSIFKGKKRRRRKRKSGSDSDSLVSYDSYGAQSETSSPLKGGSNPSPVAASASSAQQEWINGGGNGLADMAAIDSSGSKRFNSSGGRGNSLPKITEGFNEDASGDFNKESSGHRRGKRRGTRPKPTADGSVTSKDNTATRKNKKGLFRSKEKAIADPLSLVVLLVEPTSLRFELLSLDFDLTTKKPNWKERRRAKKKSEEISSQPPPELELTVQDVLDQITPTALTDEKLQKKVSTPGSCLGLIDRTGTVHFGETSLETACAERPLREFDRQLLKNDDKRGSYLSVPTYGGEPHRDVLLGFFGKAPDAEGSSGSSNPWTEAVSKTLELARPIFADPNVIGLMESSGYNLVGWKPGSQAPEPAAVLGKPLPPPVRTKQPSLVSRMKQPVLALIVLLLATFLAWSVVSTGLSLLPSIEDVVSPESDAGSSPKTLEGYVAKGFGMLLNKNKDILAAK